MNKGISEEIYYLDVILVELVMNNIVSTNKKAIEYYRNIAPVMKKFCHPLEHIGIELFIYFKVYLDGSYILLTNDFKLTKEYCSRIVDDNLQSYVQLSLARKNKNNIILWPNYPMTAGMEIFYDKNYWHGLTFDRFNADNIECCSFLAHRGNYQIGELFFKKTNFLEKFSNEFKQKNSYIISRGELCKAQYKNGYNFDLAEKKHENLLNLDEFLKDSGIDIYSLYVNGKCIHFSLKEFETLKWLNQGFSVKGIAKKMNNISPKTVETYLKRIRYKTDTHHKEGLINIYRKNFDE